MLRDHSEYTTLSDLFSKTPAHTYAHGYASVVPQLNLCFKSGKLLKEMKWFTRWCLRVSFVLITARLLELILNCKLTNSRD